MTVELKRMSAPAPKAKKMKWTTRSRSRTGRPSAAAGGNKGVASVVGDWSMVTLAQLLICLCNNVGG
jgi:hypothetical protein